MRDGARVDEIAGADEAVGEGPADCCPIFVQYGRRDAIDIRADPIPKDKELDNRCHHKHTQQPFIAKRLQKFFLDQPDNALPVHRLTLDLLFKAQGTETEHHAPDEQQKERGLP